MQVLMAFCVKFAEIKCKRHKIIDSMSDYDLRVNKVVEHVDNL